MNTPEPPFLVFLRSGLERGSFETDDALMALLPLMRQTLAAHEKALVAPLEGLAHLEMDPENHLKFQMEHAQAPRRENRTIEEIQKPVSRAVQVIGESRHTIDLDGGGFNLASLDIGQARATVTKPVFLTGYISWEHRLSHHDEVTDIFSLGLLLASVACGLDFTDPDDLELFVRSRNNLFALNSRLHPVVASVIVQMTELNRHRRAQDLTSLIRRLENYREQQADLDLKRIPGLKESGATGCRKLIQAHLRDRLFDMSRRNRLIHFKPTLQTLNLTLASVPLVLDYRSIRPEQLFTWHPALASELIGGAPMSLGKYLRFEDAPYIPGVLDKIIGEARRDRAEYGFAQLRVVLVFLRWHNLKEEPRERIHSPLLLLPVQLTKKRGVRDSYVLDPTSSEAEVNPALRHYLKHLYNLELPETVDLKETSLETFHTELQKLIQASEPAVILHKVDRPQIQLIHERARQRLDQYRRRLKQRARGPRASQPIDYSYDREQMRPLGLQLFKQHIKPQLAPLRQVAGAPPAPRSPNMVFRHTEQEKPSTGTESSGNVFEKERRMFSLREGEQETAGNPYSWEFDLCALTLGNFNYRKMTLVQDYSKLIESELESQAFERIFSMEPRSPEEVAVVPLPLSEQHVVIPCDATQSLAIARARTGGSYIIQGPPGTGKSQTITNLIADYVARGKRVLFVCEKRAAIDVVFHRLRQQGLDELCCLIHDSQTDKKSFIQNLKQTSERWLANPEQDSEAEKKRAASVRMLEQELTFLSEFSASMSRRRENAGLPVRALLERLIEIRSHLVELEPQQAEQLPPYQQWLLHRETAERIAAVLVELGEEPCLARHPFRWLNGAIFEAERPLETLRQRLERAETLLDEVDEAFSQSGLAEEQWDTIEEIEALLVFVLRVQPLAERNLLGLLEPQSEPAKEFTRRVREQEQKIQAASKAKAKTVHWRQKLPADETQTALEQARKFQGSFLGIFNPAWWRLRRVLRERYDFNQHAVKPGWVQILEELAREWQTAEELEANRAAARVDYGKEELPQLSGELMGLQQSAPEAPAVEALRQLLLKTPDAPALIARLARLQSPFSDLLKELRELLMDYRQHGFTVLGEAIRDIREASDLLPEVAPALSELGRAPEEFSRALRHFPLLLPELEAAMAQKTLTEIYRGERGLNRFDGRVLARRMERLAREHIGWLSHNAAAVRAGVRQRFMEHVKISSLPAAQLTPEQKVFKKNYSAGRRELEHEFEKTMRYKSIRELASGATGEVVRDLKPIWLMSPLSVSDTLPLEPKLFDVVIFDEASQIPLEEAVPALYRAQQVIVVGDEMQLPPTNFFTAAREGEDGVVMEEEGERIEVALDADSFLTQSTRNLPSTMLAWHYRSRYEGLISYSNAAFYGGNLFTIPDRQVSGAQLGEIRVQEAAQGDAHVDALLARNISYHLLEQGVYEQRRNPAEAAYIARLVRSLLQRETGLSIGIVAFSEAQQSELEDALERLADEDEAFKARLEVEMTREENDQFCGLFIKNLENVQGDERDVIILSICYGYDADQRMFMNFGPINQRGGEKRLNVIFSRAKHHMAVVTSIHHDDITNEYNDGANALKNFLHYAEMTSKGDASAARRVLENLNPLTRKSLAAEPSTGALHAQLAEALRKRGYFVELNVGQSRFRCDLAIRCRDERQYQLGILVDSEQHYGNPDLLERYLMQPAVLNAFGWRVIVVLARDWFHEPEAVIQRVERILRGGSEDISAQESAEIDAAEEAIRKESLPEKPIEPKKIAPQPDANPALTPSGLTEKSDSSAQRVRKFEFISGASKKFWEIAVTGKSVTVRFGRIGTAGQEQKKVHADEERARREAEKLIAEKVRKGYVERG